MKVLVLGASGFIGGAVAAHLEGSGHEVSAFHRPGADVDAPRVVRGTLGDPERIAAAAKGVDAVVHAAGLVSSRSSARALQWTHVAGTENVVNACRHAGVPRLVLMSCADVTLGNLERVQWDENKQVAGRPFGERARSLQLAEEVALSAAGLDVVALRPAWVWGPGDTSRLPGLCREGLDGGIRLVGSGTTYMATTYIEHLTVAVESALTASAETVAGRPFHLADPVFQHARDFFSALSERLDLPPPRTGAAFALRWPLARIGQGPLTADEVLQRGRSTLLDFNAAIGKLGYEPDIAMETGLDRLAAWVEAEGGVRAVAELERAPSTDAAVDQQVAAAGGD
ncbi:MAG: NAD-dependent epimerase/dehydratase family protein [Sandaracinaceae bacterium]